MARAKSAPAKPRGGATAVTTTHPAHAVRGGISLIAWPAIVFLLLVPIGGPVAFSVADANGMRALGFVLAGCFGGLAFAVHEHAEPRQKWVRRQGSWSIGWAGGFLGWVVAFGPGKWWFGLELTTGLALTVWWAFAKTEPWRGNGSDAHAAADDAFKEELGLPKSTKSKRVDEGDNHSVTRLDHPDMTPEDVVRKIPNIAAKLGTTAQLVRWVPGQHDGQSFLKFLRADLLKNPLPWNGPEDPGGTVATGVCLGTYEHGVPMRITVVGDPDAAQPKPAVPTILVVGQTRAGKTQLALITLADLASRRDVVFMGADIAKGDQWIPLVRPLLQVCPTTLEGVRALLAGLGRMRDYRVGALTSIGLREWTPKAWDLLGMPEVYAFFEEAAQFADELDDELTRNAETLGSVGIHVAFSLQRASHSIMPTDMRAQIPAAAVFGVREEADADMASEAVNTAGGTPWKWQNKHPGKLYLDHPHVDEDLLGIPGRTWRIAEWQIVQQAALWAPLHEGRLDAGSAQALGDVWVKREQVTVRTWRASKKWGKSPYLRHPKVSPVIDAAEHGDLAEEVAAVKARVAAERKERVTALLAADPALAAAMRELQDAPAWGTPPPARAKPTPAEEEHGDTDDDEDDQDDEELDDVSDAELAREVAAQEAALEAKVTQQLGPDDEQPTDLPGDLAGLTAAADALLADTSTEGVDYSLPDDGHPVPSPAQRRENFRTLCADFLQRDADRVWDPVGERWYVDAGADDLVDRWLDFPGERDELRPSLYRRLKAAEKGGHVRDLRWGKWRLFDTILDARLPAPTDDDGEELDEAAVEATLSDPALADA